MCAPYFPNPMPSPSRAGTNFQMGLGMLTRRVYFHMVRSASRLLAPFHVTVEQYVVLLCLDDEGALTQRELVRRCSSDPRTMGKMLDLLSVKGWIRRAEHATDRRAWQVSLTPLGRKAKRRMDEALVPLRARPAQALGASESAQLRNLMAQLADALDPSAWLTAPVSARKSHRP
jgi:DNA-binding MarR family transcriptional regulator